VYVGGITSYISSSTNKVEIKESTVKGELNGKQYTAGFIAYLPKGVDCKISNSQNYATINASSIESAGFVARCYGGVLIENCINYGNLNAGNYGAGGMVGWNQGNKLPLKIRDCANFGDIVSSNSTSVGPIVGVTEGFLDVDGFESGGTIVSGIASLVGEMSTRYTQETYIRVNRIVQRSEVSYRILGLQTNQNATNKKITIVITNCEIDSLQKTDAYLVNTTTGIAEIYAKNIKIKDKATSAKALIYSIENSSKVYLENIYIEASKTSTSTLRPICVSRSSKSEIIVKSIILNNKDKKMYCGSDFSDFCVDWKTGKIDLVARNGKGFFHTRLDEEWLLNKGYQKREI